MFLIRYSIKNPLTINLMLFFVLITGVLSWFAMPQEMFPVVELDKVSIRTVFEGASPEEVERQVTLPIEEEFDGMADIDVVSSISSEGVSTITIKFKSGTDIDDFMRDARAALDQVTDLPDEAEKPLLHRLETRFPVISMSLSGDMATSYLTELSAQIKVRLLHIPGVASVGIAGDREWELWVVVDPDRLAAVGVSLAEISTGLRSNLRDLPGGSVRAKEGDILLRGVGVSPDPESVASIVLRSNDAGGQLTLGDVAVVEHRLEEVKTLGRFDGKPSVNLTVTKTAEASTIEVSRRVRELAEQLKTELPSGVQVDVFSDLSIYVKTRLETVKSSGLVGLVLVLLSLYLFLNFRIALITAMGIPVSFLVAVILIHYLGFTINMVSLFAFLIALGMIVDDAIIVTENIYRHMELGEDRISAAIHGTREVFWPVVASTTTTIAAFLPMFAIGGIMGAFVMVIPVVVSAALLGSLFEAFVVLPSHAAELLRVKARSANKTRIDWVKWLKQYCHFLRWSLRNRYFVSSVAVGVLVVTVVFAVTRIPFQLFGHVDVGQFFVNIEAPNTYSIDDSAELAGRLEQVIFETVPEDELETLLTNVGLTFIDFNRLRFGSEHIQLIVNLNKQAPSGFIERFVAPIVSLKFAWDGTRERSADEIINQVRERLGEEPGIKRMSILRPQGGPAGSDIEIGVMGHDIDDIRTQAEDISGFLERLSGVYDVRQDLDEGKLEYQYLLNDQGRELGLTQSQLAEAVRTGFLGLEVVHVNWENKRIPVRLIFPDNLRRDIQSLAQLRITLDDGRTVFLGDVATIKPGRSLNTVSRRNLQRLATIQAEVDSDVSTPLEVTRLVDAHYADFSDKHPGLELLYLGEKQEASESFDGMTRAMVISLAIIFFVLGALFKSLLDPLVVMCAIPFGAIGVIFGHVLFGDHLQFLSMVGFLALSGIVVNDSLILVDFAKRMRAEGWDRIDAMVEAGRVRIRPILLTSATTFLGISPLIFFASGQTAFLSPMAISLGFGLLFSTVLILVVLPCFYIVADDGRQAMHRLFHRLVPTYEDDEVAAPVCRLEDHE